MQTDQTAIADFANDPQPYDRKGVAEDPNCPVETLLKLASDPDWNVVIAATENPNLSHDAMLHIVEEGIDIAIVGLSSNRQATSDVLWKIFRKLQHNEHVVEAIALHDNTPTELLIEIVKLGTKTYAPILMTDREVLPDTVFEALLRMNNTQVNLELLNREDILPEVVKHFVVFGATKEKLAILNNAYIELSSVIELAFDQDATVCRIARDHQRFPKSLRALTNLNR